VSLVPCMESRKIDLVRVQVLLSTVDELIDTINGAWDEDLLRLIFNPLEVSCI
jgi:hypothetical protein